VPARIGPIEARLRVVPSLTPGVQLLVPPAGQVEFDTHLAPVSVQARIAAVDLEGARSLIDSSRGLEELQSTAPDTLRRATLQAAATTAGCALGGAVVLSLLVYRRRWRRTAQVAAAMTGVLVGTAGGLVATFDSDRLAQPRFTGLLSQAPYVAGQASSLVRRLESYRTGLADIVQGVTTLYATSGRLPVLPGGSSDDVVTVLHISDIHLNPIAFDLTDKLVEQFEVDLVVDTGDITNWGTEVESGTVARVGQVKVPYVFVRGNHDSLRTQQAVAAFPNAVVLDGRVAEVRGLVIAGIGDPRFTPESAGPPPSAPAGPTPADVPSVPSPSASSPGGAVPGQPGPPSVASAPVPAERTPETRSPAGAGGPLVPTTRGTAGAAGAAGDQTRSPDPQIRSGARLARVIAEWNAANPGKPVSVAAVHEPYAVPPLLGTVPLVLAGHFHRRDVRLDPSGTRVMIQGSTGGAGVSSAGFQRLSEGEPVPLDATLLYVARRGERAGQVLAYDEITVGGFGLASVALNRTVVRPDEPALAPGAVVPGPQPTPSSTGSPAAAPSGSARPGG
jgi:predicted MPP superfamily phosphohydrolase